MFFSSLFDTGTKSARDLVLGRAVLQLLALSERGPILTALHAFNSTLVLSQVDDAAFRALVERGRITFRSRYDEVPPRELFLEMLSTNRHVHLGAWPDFVVDGVDRKEMRHAAAAFFRDKRTKTTVDAVDENIDRVQRLLSAIDVAVKNGHGFVPEQRYRTPPATWTFVGPVAATILGILAAALGAEAAKLVEKRVEPELVTHGAKDTSGDPIIGPTPARASGAALTPPTARRPPSRSRSLRHPTKAPA